MTASVDSFSVHPFCIPSSTFVLCVAFGCLLVRTAYVEEEYMYYQNANRHPHCARAQTTLDDKMILTSRVRIGNLAQVREGG